MQDFHWQKKMTLLHISFFGGFETSLAIHFGHPLKANVHLAM
jgi:hypothetical protein